MRDVAVGLSQVLKKKDGICRTKFAKREPQEIALKAGRKAVTILLPECSRTSGCRTAVPILLVYDGARSQVGVTAETSVNKI